MYNLASNLFTAIADPAGLLLLMLAGGTVLLWTRWRRAGRRLVLLSTVAFVAVAVLPLRTWLILPLENRFPIPVLPDRVDGIVVLGGAQNLTITATRHQPTLNDNAERVTAFAALAHSYPEARLVVAGGYRGTSPPAVREGEVTAAIVASLGVAPERLIVDDSSRNTWDNATYALRRAVPAPGETWLLITSARHMPRAVGTFRRAGWADIVPYPVDFTTVPDPRPSLRFGLESGIDALQQGQYEWIALVTYRVLGRTASLFPGP
jgi:uncharacterized SAM-binding protein YcdF (DUF218 family)